MTKVFALRERAVPLPGRPCRIPWLAMPTGWTVRSDGRMFFFCLVGDLRAMMEVFAPRDLIRERFGEMLGAVAAEGTDATDPKRRDVQQSFRIVAHTLGMAHGLSNRVVLGALTEATASVIAGTGNPQILGEFVQTLLERYAQVAGAMGAVVPNRIAPPFPPKPHGKTH